MVRPVSALAIAAGGVFIGSRLLENQTSSMRSPAMRWWTPLATVSTSGSSGMVSSSFRLDYLLRSSGSYASASSEPDASASGSGWQPIAGSQRAVQQDDDSGRQRAEMDFSGRCEPRWQSGPGGGERRRR